MVATALGLTATTPAQTKFMDVADVKPGMKGYGLTVMRGTKPERFDVEIISTLHNFRPSQDLIIIRTNHPKLDIARTVAGMSGSPIYIDGKMIGAYAYGWFFNVEPIAGVTPIQSMLDDLRRPVPPTLMPTGGGALLPGAARRDARQRQRLAQHRFNGSALDYDLRGHAKQVADHAGAALAAPGGTGLKAASTDVMAGGLSPRAMKLARELLQPAGLEVLQASSGGGHAGLAAEAGDQYVDGGVINVQFVRGDISVAGVGTVTHVVGDKLVAFGHPLLNGGIEALPTAHGYVHWILATQNRSFKLAEPIKPQGTLINDRQASIVIDTNAVAPMFPLSLDIDGARVTPDTKTDWRMHVAHDQFLSPSFVAIGMGSALAATTGERSDMTWRATSKVAIKGLGSMSIEDFGAGNRVPIGPSDVSRTRLVRAVGAVLNNPWEMGEIAAIETQVRVMHDRDVRFLRGAQLLESEVAAGEPARVKLTLQPYRGKRTTRTIEIPLDKQLAGKTVQIRLQPGYLVDRIVAPPNNLKQLVQVLDGLNYPGETIIASYDLPNEATAAFEGNIAYRLPPGAVDTLRPTTSSISPTVFTASKHIVIPTSGFMIGQDTVSVKVREVIH